MIFGLAERLRRKTHTFRLAIVEFIAAQRRILLVPWSLRRLIRQTGFDPMIKHDRQTHDHREPEFAAFSSRRLNYVYPRGAKFPRFPASFPTEVSAHRPTYARLRLSSISQTHRQWTLFWDASLSVPSFVAGDSRQELLEIEKRIWIRFVEFHRSFWYLDLEFSQEFKYRMLQILNTLYIVRLDTNVESLLNFNIEILNKTYVRGF